MRVRQFTQDDAHILCTPEQLNHEIRAIADFVGYAMGIFGFEYEVELSRVPRTRSVPMKTGSLPQVRSEGPQGQRHDL